MTEREPHVRPTREVVVSTDVTIEVIPAEAPPRLEADPEWMDVVVGGGAPQDVDSESSD